MTLPLDELAEALKKATPGPWKAGRSDMTSYDLDGIDPFKNVYVDDDGPSGPVARGYGLSGNEKVAHANAALIVLLRNNADALVEAAKKAEELEVAHELSGQRYANAIELWGEKKARAEESARKLAEAEREVAALKEELAGNVRRESAVIDQQTPPDDELRLIIQVEEEGGTVSLLAIVAKRLLEARRLVRWHMAIGGEYEALQAENAKLREALHPHACHVDPLSWHGEAMLCDLCGAGWNNGEKRNEPATPELHMPDCLFYEASPPPKSAGTKEKG